MFEARLAQADLFRKVLESCRELVQDASFDATPGGLSLQAMDSSHVSLVSLTLRAEGFAVYACERPFSMGVNLNHLAKVLRCAGPGDSLLLRTAGKGSEELSVVFESPDGGRVSHFSLRLMDVASENLTVPESQFEARVAMASVELQRIVRDLGAFGATLDVAVSTGGVRFSASGDLGSARVICREVKGTEGGRGGATNGGGTGAGDGRVAPRGGATDPLAGVSDAFVAAGAAAGTGVVPEDPAGDAPPPSTPAATTAAAVASPSSTLVATAAAQSPPTSIELNEPVELSFANRYLASFTRATPLSPLVRLKLSRDMPIVVEYPIQGLGALRYYLAPKIDDDDDYE